MPGMGFPARIICKKILTCFLIFLTIYLFDIHYGRKVNNKGADVE